MNLLNLMRESRAKLSPNWVIASLVCVLYGLLVGVPSGLNTYGELLSFLLAGPLQLGIAIYFLNILNDRPASIENLIMQPTQASMDCRRALTSPLQS